MRILVTSALPYANGHIHIGHLVEYLQTDFWVRFQRLRGRRCVYVCADDTHGTSIMIRARQEGRSEIDVIRDMSAAHQRDFAAFQIRFDHYGSTHSAANRERCAEIWSALRGAGLVSEREVTQLYDASAGTFLADRFVKGTCPNCKSPGQHGDNCEKCSASYSAVDLIDPVSTLSGTRPELRSATHLFVRIEELHGFLADWTREPGRLQPEIANYLAGQFLSRPLRDWDVSRPAPYFGFEIPDAPGQYWYVWFDAPIGYIAATDEWCELHGERADDWWRSPETRIHHFIGKDIAYFHTLFWPAMLRTAGFSLPERVHVHGFLTVGGEKMSKSKGTFVLASTYLEHLDPSYLRYYYASKLGARAEDIDLDLEDFVDRVNAELVGKLVNLASRTARFVKTSGLSPAYPDDGGLFAAAARTGAEIAEAYEACDTARVTRLVMALCDRANEYVDRTAPWMLARQPAQAAALRDACTVALNLFRQLAVYLAPILPRLAEQTGELLNRPLESWADSQAPLLGTPVAEFRHLAARVDPKKVQAMIAASTVAEPEAAPAPPGAAEDDGAALAADPIAPECTIDDFVKADLRVARVVAAEDVPEAKKLLRLTVSLGGGVTRTLLAGIKGAYRPEELVGRLVVVVANLAPRKMKLGTSEGMIVAASSLAAGERPFLVAPDPGAKPGMRLK
jgi:methionyl-tRNA synthetase